MSNSENLPSLTDTRPVSQHFIGHSARDTTEYTSYDSCCLAVIWTRDLQKSEQQNATLLPEIQRKLPADHPVQCEVCRHSHGAVQRDCPLSSHKGHWWHQVGKGHSAHHVSFIASVDRQTRTAINGDWLGVIPTDIVRFVTVAALNFLLFLCLQYQQENKLSSYSFQTEILLPVLLRYMFFLYLFLFSSLLLVLL